jgi:hypothetical protein
MRSVILLVAAAVMIGAAAVPSPSFAQAKAKKELLPNATVKSVSASSIVVTSVGKDTTFAVDGSTVVVGKGIGTKSKAKQGKPSVADLLKEGDRVTVTYADVGGTLRASRIEVAAKNATR